MLESEGVLTYIPHVGHTVVRLDSNELAEIYALRALIETELLKSIDLKEVDVVRLRQLHHEIETAMNDLSIDDITRLNVEFHFAIFGYTPFKIMLAELTRLWNMSGFYRSVQVFDTEQRSRIIEQHGGIIDAIKARDVDQLIASSDLHRSWRLPANAFPIRRNSS